MMRRYTLRFSFMLPRLVITTSVAVLALLNGAALAQSRAEPQSYPVRPVRMIVPNLAGSATDAVTRMVAQRLSESWGQQVVVDNRAGASGIIGHELTARAAPDGYTLLMSTSAGLIITPLLGKVPYDSARDFAPVSLVVISPQMLVSHPSLPAANVEELVALARAKPKQLNCASPGTGTSNHLGCELIKVLAKVEFLHVPYKGTSLAINDLVGGQVHFMFNSMPAVWPLAKAGKLRALAHGGTKRSPAAPEVPTVAESIPGFQCITWYAMVAPRGTPPAIVARVNGEIVKMLADPPFAKRLSDQGQEPQSTTPAELTAHMRAESERWAGVIKAAGLATAK
ncbi:MAG TPA: tripartite tricarboxylate transporter substrate binding protein [Burkholderiales bacterium]|nr:tripartite tricarboxylate transporter substrate binding protein [Burkholderiales bacterium]